MKKKLEFIGLIENKENVLEIQKSSFADLGENNTLPTLEESDYSINNISLSC